MEQGVLLILSGPSGSGKGTVMKRYVAGDHNAFLSVSMTTRKPRPGEIDGKDYYFVSMEQFKGSIDEGKLIEYAKFGENYYGTPLEPVMEHLREGHIVFLEIEVQGALQVKKKIPEAVLVFFSPDSFGEVERRLRAREKDNMPEAEIQSRLRTAKGEYLCAADYDYLVVNNRIEDAALELAAIARAEQCRIKRRAGIVERICRNFETNKEEKIC